MKPNDGEIRRAVLDRQIVDWLEALCQERRRGQKISCSISGVLTLDHITGFTTFRQAAIRAMRAAGVYREPSEGGTKK